MKCILCKTREVNNPDIKVEICDVCVAEIQMAFTFYIGGKEVTKEEHDKFIEGEIK